MWAKAEGVMDSLGMMSGPLAMPKRAVFGAIVGYGIMEAVRPSFAYYDNGEPRPFALSQIASDRDTLTGMAHGTYFNNWMAAFTGAVVFSQFI